MKRQLATLALTALTLSACSSWFDTNQPYLQSTSNLIPGERIVANDKTTAYALSKKYNVPMNDLIVLNRLGSPYVIWPGQEITLPATAGRSGNISGGNYRGRMNGDDMPRAYASPRNTGVSVSELPPPTLAAPALNGESQATQLRSLPQQAVADFQSGEKFLWPVEGPVLLGYGPRNSGGSNDGLNIAAPRGTPVVAAANGIVLHAGNDAKGFGNLVLIRHGNNYITAYAHLDRMIVDKDSVVTKGDMIGTVGSTGEVKGPQLHFQIRKNGKPVDPTPLLPPAPQADPYSRS
jgi:murein DD-endopeptidase MepM/ murein hydrolase activator NlpD